MDLGSGGIWLPDQKDLEIPSSWVPITPVRPAVARRPPLATGNSHGSQLPNPSSLESVGVPGWLQNTDCFFQGNQSQNGSSHSWDFPERPYDLSKVQSAMAPNSRIHDQIAKPIAQPIRNPREGWTQVTFGRGAGLGDGTMPNNSIAPYSPFMFNASVGSHHQQNYFHHQMLLNGKVALNPHFFSVSKQTPPISQNGVSVPNLPNNKISYSPQAVRRTVPLAPSTPDKCNRVQDGQPQGVVDLEDYRLTRENKQEMNITRSDGRDPIQICFSQGAPQPDIFSYGGFTSLLANQSQSKEGNWGVDPSKVPAAPLAPVTPDKCNRIQNGQPPEVIDLVDDRETQGNRHEENGISLSGKETIQITFDQGASVHAEVSCLGVSSQEMESQKQINRETQGIDLNKTPQQKLRRKKHRPKVIREGKPARTPKKATPKSAGTVENPSGKRKYVRRKGINPTNTPASGMGQSTTPVNKTVRRSAKRTLNFDSEDVPVKDGLQASNLQSQCNTQSGELNEGKSINNSSSVNKHTQRICHRPEDLVESSSAKPVFDLNDSINQVPDNCTVLQENSVPTSQPSRREMLRANLNYLDRMSNRVEIGSNGETSVSSGLQATHQYTPEGKSNTNGSMHSLFTDDGTGNKGLKRDFNLSANNALPSYQNMFVDKFDMRQTSKNINSANGYQNFNGNQVNNLHAAYKKIRTENGEQELVSNASSSVIPSFPTGGEHLNNPFKEVLSFAFTQKLVALGRLQDAQRILTEYVQTERKRKKMSESPTQVRNQPPSNQIMPPAPNMRQGYGSREVLDEGPPKELTRRRQAKKSQPPGANAMSLNSEPVCQQECENSASTLGQRSGESTASPQGICQGKVLHNFQMNRLQGSQINRSFHETIHSSSFVRAKDPNIDPVDLIIQRLNCLIISGVPVDDKDHVLQPQNALVPYKGDGTIVPFEGLSPIKKRPPRAKVDLDSETNRVWLLLMGKEGSYGAEGTDKDKEKWWEEERKVFRGRVDSFIARMHLVQGDRRFSRWKGSVVDSVVGVFLTQNVSDHLSSSAFMALAARFPSNTRDTIRESNMVKSSLSSENQVVSIIELADDIKLPEEMSNEHQVVKNSRNFHEVQCIEIADSEPLRRNTGNAVIGDLKCRDDDSCGREAGSGIASPANKINTPLALTQRTSLAETEDMRFVEGIPSSQNSVISSQNSSDSPVQTVDRIGMNSESNSDVDDLLSGNRWNCLDASTPFMDLLQMAGTGMFGEMYTCKSGTVASKESFSSATNLSESVGTGKRKSGLDNLSKLNGTCQSVDSVDSHLYHARHDFTGVSSVLSTSHFCRTTKGLEVEGAEIIRERQTILPSVTSELPNATCIQNLGTVGGTFVKDTAKIAGQKKSTLSFLSPSAGDSNPNISDYHVHSVPSSDACVENDFCYHDYVRREWAGSSVTNSIPYICSALTNSQAKLCQKDERGTDIKNNKQVATEVLANTSNSAVHGVQSESSHCTSTLDDAQFSNRTEEKVVSGMATELKSKDVLSSIAKVPTETAKSEIRAKKGKVEKERKNSFDWDTLRKEVCNGGAKKERSSDAMDSINWEAIRNADVKEISDTIRERGMNNMLAERIKDFLNRLVRDHGSIDLEWLRDIPPDKAKDYLLSMRGLGLKSVECVRLLTLHHLAFPVDTNVGRICVRLGWVPLQPLPESLQLHLLEMYPMLETIQKYLWPRLCKLDQRTLYELHYQLITFGKVFCTKSKPNCNACPMRGECKHFASAFASARLALPGPEEKSLVTSENLVSCEPSHTSIYQMPLPQIEGNQVSKGVVVNNSEPIIEEPTTPEPEPVEILESDIEDFYEDPDEIPTIKLNIEQFTQNLQDIMQGNNMELQEGDLSKALVSITPEVASIPQPKLKNVSRLRTEHQVYELPDSHPLLEGLDEREKDDPCPYLLAIWTPGETAQSTEPPDISCNSQDMGKLCDRPTCFSCNSIREAQAQIVRGTLLIPCRTAMRGSFPLNGTYFQVNEVFADHSSSHNPIDVPRNWIWNLPRRTVYFGTSVTSIFRGLTTEGIQHCFWRGFVCVRAFDQKTRAPRPLLGRLHLAASKVIKNKKMPAKEVSRP